MNELSMWKTTTHPQVRSAFGAAWEHIKAQYPRKKKSPQDHPDENVAVVSAAVSTVDFDEI